MAPPLRPEQDAPPRRAPRAAALREVGGAFLLLGLVSFGGPIAHLGYFHSEFVRRRKWVDDAEYADLVALCQFLPGPASSQVCFALGMRRAGVLGALLASLCFLLPSAALMIALGYGVTAWPGVERAGWVHGLRLAAVAVVAQAVLRMARTLCPDRARLALGLAAAALLIAAPAAWTQVGAIAAGAAAGLLLCRRAPATAPPPAAAAHARTHPAAVAALATCGLLLLLPPLLARATGSRAIAVFDAFYRAGALVFGGGHVVLPLLRAEVVPRGWVSDAAFLAGYGAAQAAPGPLFSFAGYLGAIIHPGPLAWLGGLGCLVAIFLPAWLLVGGALPFWQRLRALAHTRAALAGANAAVVGVLAAALVSPVIREGVRSPLDAGAALLAFALLQFLKAPPIASVLLCAAVGVLQGQSP